MFFSIINLSNVNDIKLTNGYDKIYLFFFLGLGFSMSKICGIRVFHYFIFILIYDVFGMCDDIMTKAISYPFVIKRA